MAADEEKKTTTSTTKSTAPTTAKNTGPATKKTAKAPTAKKPAARHAATNKSASKPASKTTPAKGVNVKKTTTSKPSAPLKAGATRAASTSRNGTTKNGDTNSDLKGRAINTVRSAANEGRTIAGEAIGSLSEMIEGSAKSIDENLGEKYGNYARSAADSVSSFANKVNSKDVDEMVEDARNFVRKKPAIAIGAAAVVGLLVSRLIKSGMDDNK